MAVPPGPQLHTCPSSAELELCLACLRKDAGCTGADSVCSTAAPGLEPACSVSGRIIKTSRVQTVQEA